MGIKAAVALEKGEYQTNLKPPPKKIALHCEELDQFQNEIDSQPSTQLFSVDVKNNAVHYKPPHMYLPLSSSSPLHSLHFTLLDDENHQENPRLFNLVLLINDKIGIYRV